jgi:hypothetical protein
MIYKNVSRANSDRLHIYRRKEIPLPIYSVKNEVFFYELVHDNALRSRRKLFFKIILTWRSYPIYLEMNRFLQTSINGLK